MADQDLFSNPIYEHFDDRGSPSMGFHFRTATSQVIVDFQNVPCYDRMDGLWHGQFNFGITYLDDLGVPSDYEGTVHDKLTIFPVGNIIHAVHLPLDLSKELPTPTDFFTEIALQGPRKPGNRKETVFYNQWPAEDPESDTGYAPTFPPVVSPPRDQTGLLLERAVKIWESFKTAYSAKLESRIMAIGALYPINPAHFFWGMSQPGSPGEAMGTVFDYQIHFRPTRACCDPSARGGAGFSIGAQTDKFRFMFDYDKNAPDSVRDEYVSSLHIGKSNMGLEIHFDELFNTVSIQETGSNSILLGEYYDYALLQKKDGPEPETYARKPSVPLVQMAGNVWAEFRENFQIPELARRADGMSKNELESLEKTLKMIQKVPDMII